MSTLIRILHYTFLSFLLLSLIGCSSKYHNPSFSSKSSFIQDYSASGRILLKTPEQQMQGEVRLFLSQDQQLKLQAYAPWVGTLLFEVQADSDGLMAVDHREQVHRLVENARWSRLRYLGVDVTIEELSWVVWGRLSKKIQPERVGHSASRLRFEEGGYEYEVVLAKNGLIQRFLKSKEGVLLYDVQVRSYASSRGLVRPKKIDIQSENKEYTLRFVMLEFDVHSVKESHVDFNPPEESTFLP